MKKTLSVIVPIYNVEKYLSKCLDSIISQTYEKLEIILINDGSTDRCGEICKNYALKDSRVKYIYKQNGGLASARNAGLDIASGDYISFVDSDDWIDTDMYETLIYHLETTDSDIAVCGIKEVFPDATRFKSNTGNISFFNITEAIESLVSPNNIVRFEVWNKVFKKDIIGESRFKDKQIYEDVFFDRKVFFRVNKMVFIDKPFYNYLKVRDGNTNSFFKENRLQIFNELEDFIDELKERNMPDLVKKFEYFLIDTAISFYYDAFRLNAENLLKKKLLNYFERYFTLNLSNIYANKFKLKIFKFSPNLYVHWLKFKLKYLSIYFKS